MTEERSSNSLQCFRPGDRLPELRVPALTRTTLALYAGGSNDHNPLHIDVDYARNVAARPDVIGHGMLIMAHLGRMLTYSIPPQFLRDFEVKFLHPYHVGDELTCRATVEDWCTTPGAAVAGRVALEAVRQDGVILVTGTALLGPSPVPTQGTV